MLERIEEIREKLHRKLEDRNSDPNETLKISQELDKLIVEYHKEKDTPEAENI